MRILVTYWTRTGNTRRVAENIFGALSGEKELLTLDQVVSLENYKMIFLGFPVMQFGLPAPVKEFILRNTGWGHFALFITHALSATASDPRLQVILDKEIQRCTRVFTKVKPVGLFHCQGELSESAASELLATGNPMLKQFADMRAATIGHPDREELDQAYQFAVTTFKEVEEKIKQL